MKAIVEPLRQLNDFLESSEKIAKGISPIQISGLSESALVQFMAGLGENAKQKVILTFSEQRAKEIYDDMRLFDSNVVLYPAKDFIFYNADIHGTLLLKQRLEAICQIINNNEVTVVTTPDGLMDKVLTKNRVAEHVLRFESGMEIDLIEIRKKLVDLGYEALPQVDEPGQFAVRGSILDIYPLDNTYPVRIDLWDDEIDIIKSFDPESQRSIENLSEITIYPATEYILSKEEIEAGIDKINKECKKFENKLRDEFKTEEAHRIKSSINEFTELLSLGATGIQKDAFIDYFTDNTVSFMDYFEDNALFMLDEPVRIEEHMDTVWQEFGESMKNRLEKGYILPGQMNALYSPDVIKAKLAKKKYILFTTLEQKLKGIVVKENYYVESRNVPSYNNNFEMLVKDLEKYKKQGYRILLLSGSKTRAERFAQNLRDYDLNAFYTEDSNRVPEAGEIEVAYGNLHKGFVYPLIKFIVITQSDIFGAEKKKKKKKKYSGERIQDFGELNIGDYVVHENHGVGIYRGFEKVEVNHVVKDYMKIEYADGGALYVLATGLDRVQKFSGAEGAKPKINKLGTREWGKTKTRVKMAVKDIAKDLVELYANRQMKEGFVYSEDTVWQREFEELFPFEETEDQLEAIEAVKKDMESRKIMDRLVCGDVGYGKTEIAIRAAFKAVQDGKQVVFLVPTTILAQQHFNTFTQRFKDFPVRVEMMSRFRTPSQMEHTITDLKKGFVDIVIGTHRVLSKDVKFKDLGLLIIDEEQRFGVTHKEKIKQLKNNVDVLTLTATPIPRTLHMSMIGIRDMSVLEEPPVDRVPIQTYVMEYNDEMVREAINRELARGGQVYYVYNRVNNIDDITARIAKLVPNANVAYAHGQMSERQLESIMYDFINGDIDVLVSTTIIETGLDISNVNTMIIHDADKLGLSQLYQLRGRVGRSNRTAYAFLMFKRDKILKEVAEKRLQAIKDFTELGSGFKIAMRDLEIRGAGNILGAQQHGHIEAVGYDLYCKMLNEAVMLQKGEKQTEDFETSIEVPIDAFIPSYYIKNEVAKLNVYRKIAAIENQDELEDMQDELNDRFGEAPRQVENLLSVALLKARAHDAFVMDISGNLNQIKLTMFEKAQIDTAKIPELIEAYKGRLKFNLDKTPYFVYKPPKPYKDAVEMKDGIFELVEKLSKIKEPSTISC